MPFALPGFFQSLGVDFSSAFLYIAPSDSADLASILAGTYDFTTVGAIDGTIVVATEEGTYSAGISLDAATTYDLYSQGVNTAHYGFMDTPVGYAIFPSALSDSEIAQAEAAFVAEGAAPRSDFGSVTSFLDAWEDCTSLTSFPQLDTSSGTSFNSAWRDCSSLTSFPLIDTSSGINFNGTWRSCTSLTSFPSLDYSNSTDMFAAWLGCFSLTSFPSSTFPLSRRFGYAWQNCSNLTSFPSGAFDNWSPSSVTNGAFLRSWDGCTSLTAQSVENILTSIDTSGIYGTNTGLSGGTQLAAHTIDIDYDGTTLSSATTTAITNLKTKDWAISINSVIQ